MNGLATSVAPTLIHSVGKRVCGIYSTSTNVGGPCVLLITSHEGIKHGSQSFKNGDPTCKPLVCLERAFLDNGFNTLKISFEYGSGQLSSLYADECIDANISLDWLIERNDLSSVFWVAGFSFGAYVGAQLTARRVEINNFVLANLPTNTLDISFMYPCSIDGLFIHADKDEVTSPTYTEKMAHKLATNNSINIGYHVVKGANHHFDGQHKTLYNVAYNYIKSQLSNNQII